MRCISRSITLLASAWMLAPAAETCVLIEGSRIHAAELSTAAPAFSALPPTRDLGPAPTGTMVRLFTRAQLAALLPGIDAVLPERLCVQRKREAIPPVVWQAAIDVAMTEICGSTPWKAKVQEAPQHRLPAGQLVFHRSGLTASRGPVQVWRGAVQLPEKSSLPVWVRAEIQSQHRARILSQAIPAGAVLSAADYREEEIWAPGVCAESTDAFPSPEGMVAKRAMPAGAELRKEDLRHPPAVHRGQTVELEAASGAARLRVPAIAEHDADLGETVQMKSGWNGSILVGRVTGAQKAKVE
jgi:flagella basal body P-ring formation protein FlgA